MGLYANRALIELISKAGEKLKVIRAVDSMAKRLNKNAYSTVVS